MTPLLAELAHDLEELLDDQRRETERQLVDHQELRAWRGTPSRARASAADHPRAPAGSSSRSRSAREEVERLLGGGRRRTSRSRRCIHARHLQVLGRRSATGRRPARRAPGSMPCWAIMCGAHAADVDALEADAAAVRREPGPRRSRSTVDLPAPLVPSSAIGLAAAQLEAHAEQHLHLAVRDVDAQAEEVRLRPLSAGRDMK